MVLNAYMRSLDNRVVFILVNAHIYHAEEQRRSSIFGKLLEVDIYQAVVNLGLRCNIIAILAEFANL